MFIDPTSANLDLLSVGIAVAAIGVMGFAVYFNNRKSITNRTFLFFSILTILWGISNYFEYKFTSIPTALWALRLHLFISVWHAFFFFQLSYVFPKETLSFKKWYKFILIPIVILTSALTLTPLVFTKINEIAPIGQVTDPEKGPGIGLFVFIAFGLLLLGLFILFRKLFKAKGIEKRQALFISMGMLLTACLILLFNVVLPVIFGNLYFIPYAALFAFPFIALTSYTIYRHKLFNVKVIGASALTFVLAIITLGEIVFSDDISLLLFRSGIFILVLIVGLNLIRGVFREVEQREKIEKLATDLETANVKLKELDKLKNEFLSFATHQLKNPLGGIKGYSSMLMQGDYGEIPKEAKDAIAIIFKQTQDLVLMVQDFLDVSKIEQGGMKYEMKPFDLKELVSSIIQEVSPSAKEKKLYLKFNVGPGNYRVNGDNIKLKQVLFNIIDNSIKYTPQGGLIVDLTNNNGEITYSVKDTGIGIAKEDIPKLFAKFSRTKEANQTNVSGTGLGMYLAKQIVEAHGGKIGIESEGKGKGSTFFIKLKSI